NQESGGLLFAEKDLDRDDRWYAKSFTCHLAADGYQVDRMRVSGTIEFKDNTNPPSSQSDRNIFNVMLNGTQVWYHEEQHIHVSFATNNWFNPSAGPYLISGDDVTLVLEFQDIQRYDVAIAAELSVGTEKWQAWQNEVYAVVWKATTTAVNDAN